MLHTASFTTLESMENMGTKSFKWTVLRDFVIQDTSPLPPFLLWMVGRYTWLLVTAPVVLMCLIVGLTPDIRKFLSSWDFLVAIFYFMKWNTDLSFTRMTCFLAFPILRSVLWDVASKPKRNRESWITNETFLEIHLWFIQAARERARASLQQITGRPNGKKAKCVLFLSLWVCTLCSPGWVNC